jgi:DNA-directed RNA polymerase subunit RPC12/RpoP
LEVTNLQQFKGGNIMADERYKCLKCSYTGWDKDECKCGSRQLIKLTHDDTTINTDFKIDNKGLAEVIKKRKEFQAQFAE